MKACGIIAEYNPLHKGHEFHIAKSKQLSEADVLVAVMSGSFTQRGEVVAFDKWTRARAAVLAGVDLVVELPFCFASAPAEIFAGGALRLLESTGCSDFCFGSETGDIDKLLDMASEEQTNPNIARFLAQGKSYASAYALATKTDFTPNDILGVEYLKAVKKYNLNINPITVKRQGNPYDSDNTDNGFASAKACRKLIAEKRISELENHLSQYDVFLQCLNNGKYTDGDVLGIVFSGLVRTGKIDFSSAAYITEGIENRIEKAAQNSGSLPEIVTQIKTKRYTYTRIMRIISCMIMGLSSAKLNEFITSGPQYIRVLAANNTGIAYMKEIKRLSPLEIITNLGRKSANEMLEFDCKATDMLNLTMRNEAYRKSKEDYTHFFEKV